MTEKVQRLVMHAFRGVPGEMAIDFGKGESIVVYGDNGTGKSTIADALEWYFTGGIELLSHAARQLAESVPDRHPAVIRCRGVGAEHRHQSGRLLSIEASYLRCIRPAEALELHRRMHLFTRPLRQLRPSPTDRLAAHALLGVVEDP